MNKFELDSTSEIARQLNDIIIEKAKSLNITDSKDLADYIIILISNKKSVEEIFEDLTSIFADEIDISFVRNIFDSLDSLVNKKSPNQNQLNQNVQQQQQQQQQQQVPEQPINNPFHQSNQLQADNQKQSEDIDIESQEIGNSPTVFKNDNQNNHQNDHQNNNQNNNINPNNKSLPSIPLFVNIPTAPKKDRYNNHGSINRRNNRGNTGINKNYGHPRYNNRNNYNNKRLNSNNTNNISKVLSLVAQNGSDILNTTSSAPSNNPSNINPNNINNDLNNINNINNNHNSKKKGRCRNFPHCNYKDCMFAHPTKFCFAFPNCPNPPGSCNYLHPGEDDKLIQEFEKTKKESFEKKKLNQNLNNNNNNPLLPNGIANPNNPFAPILMNPAATAALFQKFPPANANEALNALNGLNTILDEERSLDACKFGSSCLNPRCRFRHASTPVVCRDGLDCKRIDCYFTHPINLDCRFGINCKNKFCLFKHPEGRDDLVNKPLVWRKDDHNSSTPNAATTKISERSFAVADDEVMEDAPPQTA
ncbi:mRNA-binding protein NAB2 ASCRUDRAFT_74760 [Ascoidea rubescens DSM 1968]|uniref:RNA-binding Nab2-type zinc finger domain-containing protein n=1 Tax=Ascoidea rubescens DSM 1968 TaxID=1344418 RepID=A0A1D2VL81_9ASCO|nr:hypothetical protein ASCRUDRAFT_74760 [Ascoidea rubescens DSM 1968]ODV62368.1 hypothetical protein ASCRUDRAFT_74760 [Ascoidea rubescens DSM 1968]